MTGSWSKPLSLIASMASEHGEVSAILVTGFRRSDAIVAPAKGSFARRVGDTGSLSVAGGVGGSRSLAASQSSSTNCS